MICGTVLIPTVNVLGTWMRIFCIESAFWSEMLMVPPTLPALTGARRSPHDSAEVEDRVRF